MAERFFDGTANDLDTRVFVSVVAKESFESCLSADISHATTGHDTFFDSSASGAKCIVATVFLFLLFGFASRTHLEHAHAAREFAQTFLELLFVVFRSGVLDFVLDLLDTLRNSVFVAISVHNSGEVLRNTHFVGRTQHVDCGLFELQTLLFADNNTASEHSNVFEHGFATVAEARSFHSANL